MKDNRVGELIKVLFSHPEERERCLAALELCACTRDDVVESLVEGIGKEKSRPVQEAIVTTLLTIGTEAVVKGCAELLRSEDDYVRNAAAKIMRLLQRTSLGVAGKLLRDPDPDVRLFAVNVLGELKVKEAVELLRRAAEEDENIDVVAAAVEYLGVGFVAGTGRQFKKCQWRRILRLALVQNHIKKNPISKVWANFFRNDYQRSFRS